MVLWFIGKNSLVSLITTFVNNIIIQGGVGERVNWDIINFVSRHQILISIPS